MRAPISSEPRTPPPEAFFSPDYFAARDRFRDTARATGASLESLTIAARGPGHERLTIDIAWLGEHDARRALLHTSGVHGVEAFAGSAVQLAALQDAPRPPPGCALVLVHVLNPYGMAWLRRANENNVDLNRNFLGPNDRWEGAPALYPRIDPLINPPSPPRRDAFRPRLALLALRHGLRAPRQAIAEGQYEFPRGLFFGGKSLEEGPRLYLDWLRRRLSDAERLLAVDLHTGLGRSGRSTLILEPGINVTSTDELARALGGPLTDPAGGQAFYRARGTLGGALRQHLPAARIDFVLQEIGTYPSLTVLEALRDENRCHFHAGADVRHPAKPALLEALCPASHRWRRAAVTHGLALLQAAAKRIFAP
jgi:hypothetical protein